MTVRQIKSACPAALAKRFLQPPPLLQRESGEPTANSRPTLRPSTPLKTCVYGQALSRRRSVRPRPVARGFSTRLNSRVLREALGLAAGRWRSRSRVRARNRPRCWSRECDRRIWTAVDDVADRKGGGDFSWGGSGVAAPARPPLD